MEGLTYTARKGNKTLARLAKSWKKQGKIEVVDDRENPASTEGKGTVS